MEAEGPLSGRALSGLAGIAITGFVHGALFLALRSSDDTSARDRVFFDQLAVASLVVTLIYVALYVATARGRKWTLWPIVLGKLAGLLVLVSIGPWLLLPLAAGLIFGGARGVLIVVLLLGIPWILALVGNVLAIRGVVYCAYHAPATPRAGAPDGGVP